MLFRDKLRGFYAIVDSVDDDLLHDLLSVATVVQVRVKDDPERLREVSAWARKKTKDVGALLIINDSIAVAQQVGADGVHLGQDDLPLVAARREVGDSMLVGISTHNPKQVQEAVAGGADYLGYGPVFSTNSKENPDPVQGLAALRRAVELAKPMPVVAIGGITPATAGDVAATGAACACAIGSVNLAPSPKAAARQIADAFLST